MRKALIVGIDYYADPKIPQLYGCVNDAYGVKTALERHGNGRVNFGAALLTATSEKDPVDRGRLKDHVLELFASDSEIALFYFAGHGHIEATGGYLCGSDSSRGDDGLALGEIMTLAHRSPAKNKLIVLDCCYSGVAGTHAIDQRTAVLAEGMTILTASTKEQYAEEKDGGGLFTALFIDALSGAAANLVGDVTPGSVYAHIDQSLGQWKQRPIFRTNVKTFISLKQVESPIDLSDLQRLSEFFPAAGFQFRLDATFEPELSGRPTGAPLPIEENTAKFAILQKYNRVNLVVPVDAPHMWHAAIGSKSCELTVLGEHYRRLVEEGLV